VRRRTALSEEEICGLSDEELLRVVNLEYDNYASGHLAVARGELTRRGLSLLFTRTDPTKRPYWFVEAWREDRGFIKELFKHVFRYGLLIGTLALTKILIDHLDYPPDLLQPFEVVHYYGTLIIMLMFAISFILKVASFEFSGKHNESNK
jgi:hypothetical protein